MYDLKRNQFKHICPRNCFSSCTMISTVDNDRITNLAGNSQNPYTKGKLCAKGFSYMEKNIHKDRLKFPYYQEVKGSGKFKQITWKKAFELILTNLTDLHQKYKSFLPLALYKGSGNLGIHHFVTEQFFSSLGETTRLIGSSLPFTGFEAVHYDMGAVKMSNPAVITEASLVIIWGANPAISNIHLIPIIIEAKIRGAKIIVVDPLYTQTAELADLYIQLHPSSDGALANLLIKGLVNAEAVDQGFIEKNSFGFEQFLEEMNEMNKQEYLRKCGITDETVDLLLNLIKDARGISHIIGMGIQKHSNGGQNIRAIEALAAVHGDIGIKGGGIFLGSQEPRFFNNQIPIQMQHNRLMNVNDCHNRFLPSQLDPPIEMMLITCANPLTQAPDSSFIAKFLEDIPFVITIDQFLTPTARMSNLILPTTTHFEELDIVLSTWYKEIALNEKAISPYYESRSEWTIMNELALRLNEQIPNLCSFPIHSSEEEYLNAQFNDEVNSRFYVKSISDLKERSSRIAAIRSTWQERQFANKNGRYHFYSALAKENSLPPMPIFVDGKTPTKEHPFWLMTPHHPYALNSQFHFLNLFDEGEAFVEVHPKVAEELGVFDGEVISVYNDQASIAIKAIYSSRVPKDILLIYQGWYPKSQVNVNSLVPALETDMGEKLFGANGIAFYDTFVSVTKLK